MPADQYKASYDVTSAAIVVAVLPNAYVLQHTLRVTDPVLLGKNP